MGSSFRIGRIAWIDIGINYSWILAFLLFTWILAVGFFPTYAPGASALSYWVAGAISSVLLFISVLLHEFAHSLVARSRGMKVSSITLFIFGGVSNLTEEPSTARTEFLMAIVGPLTSLVLGGIFFLIWIPFQADKNLTVASLYYLWYANILLGVFNLIPAFPMDGGRVFRSIIWGSTKNLTKATNIAAGAGQLFGWAFIGIGVYFAFTGNIFNGLWIAFIGWFLTSAADSSRRELTMQQALRGVHVKDIMDPSPACTIPDATVNDVVQNLFFKGGYRAAPICIGDKLDGIVPITDIKKIPQEKWATTPISQIMTAPPIYTVNEDDDLGSAIKLLSTHNLNQLIVLKNGNLSGLLNRAHVIRYFQFKQELHTSAGTDAGNHPSDDTTIRPGTSG